MPILTTDFLWGALAGGVGGAFIGVLTGSLATSIAGRRSGGPAIPAILPPDLLEELMSLSPAAQATVDKINLLAARVAAVVADDRNHAAASQALEDADLVGVNNALDNLSASLPVGGSGSADTSGETAPASASGADAGSSSAATDASSGGSAVAEEPAPPVEPVALSVSPATVSFVAGAASSAGVSITGGAPPYSVSGLPNGVTYDGASLNADATTVEGSTAASVVDGDGALADLTVVISAPAG